MRRSEAPGGSADHPAAPGGSREGLDLAAMSNDELRAKIASLRAARMAKQAARGSSHAGDTPRFRAAPDEPGCSEGGGRVSDPHLSRHG